MNMQMPERTNRFFVLLRNRVTGAVVLPIVTKVDSVEDPETLCHCLENRLNKWLQDRRRGGLRQSTRLELRQPAATGIAGISCQWHAVRWQQ